METGHWILTEGVEISEEIFGFIYLITNLTNNKKYIA
jgi:hypothetical protein